MVLYEGDEAHAYLLVAEARVLLRIEYRQCNGYLKREARIRPYEEEHCRYCADHSAYERED